MLLLFAAGCGSKGAVALVANIHQPSASLDSPQFSLAWLLRGGFTLQVALGEFAPTATDVSLSGPMTLVRPNDQASLVVLKLRAVPPPPFHLAPGANIDATLTIADDLVGIPAQTLTQAEHDSLCQTRIVQIAGSLTDTASGAPTPVSSESFEVLPCP